MVSELGLGLVIGALPDGISGMLIRDGRFPAGFRIVANVADPVPRQRFTIAHEISHYVLHRDLIGEGVVDNAMYRSALSDEYERQADSFAAQILLPGDAVREAYRTTRSYSGLAAIFGVSTAAARIRLKELRLGP
jgi:Zn-dependent peptidase ImmA (M78 family)